MSSERDRRHDFVHTVEVLLVRAQAEEAGAGQARREARGIAPWAGIAAAAACCGLILFVQMDASRQRQKIEMGQLDHGTVIVFGSTSDAFGSLAGDAEGVQIDEPAGPRPAGRL